ncbi:MAG: lysylphosphatidylglycerol synthase transmembrane domain-containing protein [Planctomycetota bacterium]
MRQPPPNDLAENALPPKKKSQVRFALRLLLVAACAAAIVYVAHQKRKDLAVLLNIRPWIMAALGGLFATYYALESVRYQIVLSRVAQVRIALGEWFRLFVLAQWLNIFFPQLGTVYRGVQLRKLHGVSYTGYISSYAAFAWVDICLNMLITLAALAATRSPLRIANLPAWGFMLALLGSVVIVPLALSAFLSLLPASRHRHLAWAHTKSRQVVVAMRQSVTDAGYLARIALLGVVTFGIMTAAFGVCFLGLGLPVSLPGLTLFYALYKLSTYVVVTPGNIGLLELLCAALGEQIHVGAVAGLLACGMVRVSGYAVLAALAMGMGGLRLIRQRNEIPREEG